MISDISRIIGRAGLSCGPEQGAIVIPWEKFCIFKVLENSNHYASVGPGVTEADRIADVYLLLR